MVRILNGVDFVRMTSRTIFNTEAVVAVGAEAVVHEVFEACVDRALAAHFDVVLCVEELLKLHEHPEENKDGKGHGDGDDGRTAAALALCQKFSHCICPPLLSSSSRWISSRFQTDRSHRH